MLAVSMPNSATFLAFVEIATKCLAIARLRQLAPIFAIFGSISALKPLISQKQQIENGL
jgi:hypothetical protein